jgi:hypothetical protein
MKLHESPGISLPSRPHATTSRGFPLICYLDSALTGPTEVPAEHPRFPAERLATMTPEQIEEGIRSAMEYDNYLKYLENTQDESPLTFKSGRAPVRFWFHCLSARDEVVFKDKKANLDAKAGPKDTEEYDFFFEILSRCVTEVQNWPVELGPVSIVKGRVSKETLGALDPSWISELGTVVFSYARLTDIEKKA